MRLDYSRLSENFDHYRSFSKEVMEKYLANFDDLAHIHGGARLLDCGAGTGRFSIPLSKRYKVTALDCSRDMIKLGAGKSRRIRWVQGDLANTPFKPNHFDCTLLAYVIHQTPNFHAVVEEMTRLAPKCVVITTDMHRRLPTLLDQAFPAVIKLDRERFPPIEELQGAFILAGFERVRSRRILFESRISKKGYLDKVRHKYLSTFDLITEEEYNSGVERLEGILAELPGEEIINRSQATLVSATRL